MDRISPEQRSLLMSKVRSKNTKPEMLVRRSAHKLGFRFRLHRRDLPGSPDLVFPSLGAVIFVHGCFWHRHQGCKKSTYPKTRVDFWEKKFRRNRERDEENQRTLNDSGWKVLVVWECETKHHELIEKKIYDFLEPLRIQRNNKAHSF